jgi:homoserine kinase type II
VTPFPAELLDAWDLPACISAVPPTSGTMNETWLLDFGSGRRSVFRRHRRTDRALVEFEHAVLAAARVAGVPCPAIIPTVDGQPFLESGDRFYSLYSWAPGMQLPRAQISPAQAASAGETLARIHLALRHHPHGPWKEDPPYDPVAVDARLAAMALVVTDIGWLSDEVAARRHWLDGHGEEPSLPPERRQVIHGDYQSTNLFFEGHSVSSVIDWDKARPEWPAWEVVRTLDYGVGMEAERGTAFIAGYRSVLPLPADELLAAAQRWGHHTAHEIWLYEEVYLKGNRRAAAFIDPQPWVPFIERWRRSGLA